MKLLIFQLETVRSWLSEIKETFPLDFSNDILSRVKITSEFRCFKTSPTHVTVLARFSADDEKSSVRKHLKMMKIEFYELFLSASSKHFDKLQGMMRTL